MADFTIEQLEALKEGTTPGPWGHTSLGYEAKRYPVYGDVPGDEVALVRRQDWELVSAAPALVNALIAEKRAHAEIRKRIEERIRELKQPLCSHMPEGDEMDEYVEQWERQQYEISVLTNILNGDNQ